MCDKVERQGEEIGRLEQEALFKLQVRNETACRIRRVKCLQMMGLLIEQQGTAGLEAYTDQLDRASAFDPEEIPVVSRVLEQFHSQHPDLDSYLSRILKEFGRVKMLNSTCNNQFEHLNGSKSRQLQSLNTLDSELAACLCMVTGEEQFGGEEEQPAIIQNRIDYTPLILKRQSVILGVFYSFHENLQKLHRLLAQIMTPKHRHLFPFPNTILDTFSACSAFVSNNKFGIFRKNTHRM